jgi:site-specific DNA-adenine methylase
MKSLKTPLRYPGGKSRACVKMDPYFPDLRNYDEFREPFLGGGSVAIHITKNYPNLNIWVNDLYEPLSNFWQQLQLFGKDIENELIKIKLSNNNPILSRELFNTSKQKINDKTLPNIDRAIAFYIVNKCSFSGLTEKSTFSQQAFDQLSINGIQKLSTYSEIIKNWQITNQSYEYLFNENKKVFVYLDPPYDIDSNLYGQNGILHKEFNHNKFADDCNNSNLSQLISYNSSKLVKDRFKNWNVVEYNFNYSFISVGNYMKSQKDRKELLLFNYGVNNE